MHTISNSKTVTPRFSQDFTKHTWGFRYTLVFRVIYDIILSEPVNTTFELKLFTICIREKDKDQEFAWGFGSPACLQPTLRL